MELVKAALFLLEADAANRERAPGSWYAQSTASRWSWDGNASMKPKAGPNFPLTRANAAFLPANITSAGRCCQRRDAVSGVMLSAA